MTYRGIGSAYHVTILDGSGDPVTAAWAGSKLITKDAGTQASITATPVHEGSGQWSIALSDAEKDANSIGIQLNHSSGKPAGMQINPIPNIERGTAQTGSTASTIKLRTGASATDNFYKNAMVEIIAGTGAGQGSRMIASYVGSTKVVTLGSDWVVTPDNTSVYVVTNTIGANALNADEISDGVWDEARSGHVAAGTFGEHVLADLIEINGATIPVGNLEDQYDTTGLSGGTFPATQNQLDGIANVGSAVNRPAASYTLTTGTQSANTYVATEPLDGVRHEHTDTAGAMELYYEFIIGAGIPSSCRVTGYITGNNDDLDIYGYDWVATAWVQIGNIQGGAASDAIHSFDMFVGMVGSGADAGKVRVRFYKASGLTTATLAVDQIFVAFSQGLEGYQNAAVWFDSNASNTNTVVGVDGTPRNPVSTEAAVNTLLASTNLSRVEVALDSTITFATDHVEELWTGAHWVLDLGIRDVGGSHFVGADVSGIGTGSIEIDFLACNIGTATIHPFHMVDCGFSGTLTLGAVDSHVISNGHSALAGGITPIIDMGAALGNTDLAMPDYHNGIEIRNLNATGADTFSISGQGQIIYAASCSGTVNQRGDWKETNTGGVTIVRDDPAQNAIDANTKLDAQDAVLTLPGQVTPSQTPTPREVLAQTYKDSVNKSDQDATTRKFYADDGTTVDQKQTVSDSGTVISTTKKIAGP